MALAATAEPNRRDRLEIFTGPVGLVGLGAVAWPLIDQLDPDASTFALSATDVDIGKIPVGQVVTVKWRGKPVFIDHRTQKEIDEARVVPIGRQGDYGGWFCPCHGSQYDTSGRIRKGPAALDLQLPPYTFASDTKVTIG